MRKNVLYIYHNGNAYGGGDESLLALLSRLDRNRFNPYVLCTSGGVFTDKLKELGIEFKVINNNYLERIGRLRLLFLLIRLSIFIKKSKIKLIHINSLGRLHYLTLLCKLMRIRSVYHLRSLIVTRAIHGRTRLIVNLSDKIIAHCKHMRKIAIQAGLNKNKICVICNGVDLSKFSPDITGKKFREELGANGDTKVIGMAGRIVSWKGCDVFINAAAQVVKIIPDTKFIIVGEAPDSQYLGQLVKLAEDLGVKDKIVFVGLCSNMPEVFAALDLFVLPSWEEPFARVVLEAMAIGKPVIGTDVGGTPEQIIDNVTGLLVPPRDPVSLAEAIIKILQDGKAAKKMAVAARRRAEQLFSIKKHVRAVESIYENLLGTNKIFIYTHEFPPMRGGAATYSFEVASALSNLGSKVFVLTTKRDNSKCSNDLKLPFEVYRIPGLLGNKEKILGLFCFVYFYCKFRPAWLLITDIWAQKICSIACLLFPAKYVVTIHGSEVLINNSLRKSIKSRLKKYLFRQLCLRAEHIIAVSQYTKNLLAQNGISPDKIQVIPNGVNTEKFSIPINTKRIAEIRSKLNIDDPDKIILTLAVLRPRKGQDMVIKALPMVLDKIPKVKYVIAGNGSYLDHLGKIVNGYSLNKNVIFAGEINDNEIVHFYDMCDIFVMPSRRDGLWVEGFGISFLEANARGKPVIGGRHGGVPEVIIDNETGILVNPYSPEEIAQAVIKLLSNKELAKEMGEKGKERSFHHFNWETIAERTLDSLGKL